MTDWNVEDGEVVISRKVTREGQADLGGETTEVAVEETMAEFEARLALHLCGKLGMRVGEAAHLSSDWINERERMIEIPEYDPCTKSGGDPCGYCRSRARAHVDAMDISQERAESIVREEFDDELEDEMVSEMAKKRREKRRVTYEEAIQKWWKPKTANGRGRYRTIGT